MYMYLLHVHCMVADVHVRVCVCVAEWAQEVTESYAGIKITNMTKSWRNGMGFLAIIHYYRPDML